MKSVIVAVALAVGAMLLPVGRASAADEVRLGRSSALIGEHITMTIRVLAPAGATVEITPGTPSWAGVELVSIESVNRLGQGDGELWIFDARVAPFAPGDVAFAPTVAIIQGAEATSLALPAVNLKVVPTLAADGPLELSPLAPPGGIGGAQSPWLVPAVVVGGAAGTALTALVLWTVGRSVVRRMRRVTPRWAVPEAPPTLAGAEQLLHSDPVGAYRLMSSIVKTELARRYGVRATALTTNELRRKLESGGVRWEARLVAGLLEECDSVIYAGYRPAPERREADLNMAREIVEVAS